MAELPDRVLLYGVTGSGKSTAARAVGARTGHPVTLVDELTWLPGWVPVDGSVQRELIGDVVAGERWLLDSAYGAWLDLVLPRAELVVGLDYPRWLSLGRLARRARGAALPAPPRPGGVARDAGSCLGGRTTLTGQLPPPIHWLVVICLTGSTCLPAR
jgi:hypothetical protein